MKRKDDIDDLDSKQNKLNYLLYLIIFVLISFLSLYFIARHSGEVVNFSIFKSFTIRTIVGLLVLLILYFSFDGLRLYAVLRTLDNQIDLRHIAKLVFINIFISNVTPFATGGGFIQIYFLNKKGISLGNATAATTIRTVISTLFFFTVTPIIIMKEESLATIIPQKKILFYILLFSILYFLFFYIIIFKNRLIKRITYTLLNMIEDKGIISKRKYRSIIRALFREIDIFKESFTSFLNGDLKWILSSIIFTLLFLFSEFSFSLLLIKGLGYDVPALDIIFMQIIVVFSMYLAPTPGATGVAEGSYSLFFANFVDKASIVPLIFAWRFLTKYIGIIIGAIIFLKGFIIGGKEDEG